MKISIITPSFNQSQFIERTLQSVANQRLDLPEDIELEHVICDGASTDNTVEILKKFKFPIKWVSEKDGGQTQAVNKGIKMTEGDIIGWLNSDDIYYPKALARVASFFQQHPDVGVVYGMADHIDIDDNAFEAYPTEHWNIGRLKETCFICQPALFFRRSIVQQYGMLDESLQYCMDYEYWLRLALADVKVAYFEEKLAGSRLYEENKTLGARVRVHKEINDMFKKKFNQVPERWLINYAHAVLDPKIDRNKHPGWFVLALSLFSKASSWYWNKKALSMRRYFQA